LQGTIFVAWKHGELRGARDVFRKLREIDFLACATIRLPSQARLARTGGYPHHQVRLDEAAVEKKIGHKGRSTESYDEDDGSVVDW
jgi:hypothetical protein